MVLIFGSKFEHEFYVHFVLPYIFIEEYLTNIFLNILYRTHLLY